MMHLWGALLTATLTMIGAGPAHAHTAPSGWVYPQACCRDHQDCQMISPQFIRFEKDHIVIDVPPGGHRHAPNGFQHKLDYTSTTIRPSGDGDMHLCLGKSDYTPGAKDFVPIYRCTYIAGGS